jgi:O-antigen/teichoic acid export membrane protein
LLGAFVSVFSRKEGAKDYEGLRRTFLFATRLSICLSSFVGFGLLAWGRPFFARWMGPAYLDGYTCLMALVPGLLVALWQAPSGALMYGISRHRFLAFTSVIEGIVNLALSILLARRYGIVGVALGTSIPMLLSKIFVQPIYVCRVAQIPISEYLRRAGRTLGSVAIALIVPGLLTARFVAPDYKVLCLIGGLSLAAYAAVLGILEFNAVESNLLRQAIWPRLAAKRAVQ